MNITYEAVKANPSVQTYIKKADESLMALGYTEHSFAHVTKVAMVASDILYTLGYSEREIELAKIAGYLHDIGNVINRIDHAQSGAVMAFRILDKMGADEEDIATIITAIGNHDESTAYPVNPVAAALILADKTDVRYTRVRNQDFAIMRNIFINNYRKTVRDQTFVDHTENLFHLNLPQDSGFESTEGNYDLKEIRKIVHSLPKEYRVPFSMYVSGFKYREIAEKLGLPIGTVKSRIFFTRQRLQKDLKDFR